MPPLSVDPSALDGAGSTLIDVGKNIGLTMSTLEGALSGCASMCGNDPVGAAMGQKYDTAAAAVVQAIAAARNGLVNLGDGVRVSAHNYSMADAQSDVSGRTQPLPVPPASGKISASTPPSSVGAGDAAPAGFGWVAKYIGMIWPNGDSGRLRAAAAAWTAAGTQLLVTETSAAGPLGVVGAQQIPEGETIGKAFTESINGAVQIMNQCTTMATQLTAYAAKIDAVHAAIIDLLSRICDPMTGFKEVWDVLTGEDEDEIKQIANDIKTVIDNFKSEASALASEMSVAMSAAEEIASAMGKYADKEWNQFLHGTDVGRLLDQDLRVTKGFLGQAENLVKDNWKYGPLRAMTQPHRWFKDWKDTVTGMAPLVGLGGDGAPGVGQSWKDVGKGLLHWDEWSKDPADALGRSLFDIGTFLVPGGELGAAGKVTHSAADAAEAAAKAAPHAADAAPQVARDVAKGAESAVPPSVHAPEAPAGGVPRPLPDGPLKPPAVPDAAPPSKVPPAAEPKPGPTQGHGAAGPTERAAGESPSAPPTPHAADGPKVPVEPRPSVADVPATAAERPGMANHVADAPATAPSAASAGAGSAMSNAPSAGALGDGGAHASHAVSSAAGGAGDRVPTPIGAHGLEGAADAAGHGPHPGAGDGGGGSHGGSGDHGGGGHETGGGNGEPLGHGAHDGSGHHADVTTAPDTGGVRLPQLIEGHDFAFTPEHAFERLQNPADEIARLREAGLPASLLDGYEPLAGKTVDEFRDAFTVPGRDGHLRWDWDGQAPNDGFAGEPTVANSIPKGHELDRVGSNGGAFLADSGAPLGNRGMPPGIADDYHRFVGTGQPVPDGVPWEVRFGPAKEAFGQPGGANQWVVIDKTDGSQVPVRELIDRGLLVERKGFGS